MRIITLVTQKGGAGKTTLAASLAVAAHAAGEAVIALDLDPQRSLASWGDERKAEMPAVDKVEVEQLVTLPHILRELPKQGFTLAVLDTAGVANTATNMALQVSDLCLIPARPTRLDIQATWPTVDAVKRIGKPFAFVLNQCPPLPRNSRSTEAAAGLQLLGVLAEPTIIQRADHQDAIAAGLGVTEYAPREKAAEEIRMLWEWIDHRMTRREYGKASIDHRISEHHTRGGKCA